MSTSQGATAGAADGGRKPRAGAFDIRTFIATLVGIYGVVLIAMGLFATSDYDDRRADGINVNLWAGLGMVVLAAVLIAWALLRPLAVPATTETDSDDDIQGERPSRAEDV